MVITGDVSVVAALMKAGAVAAYPTETFYGLGACIDDENALERIIEIKGRPASKGMIVLVSDIDTACSIARIAKRQREILERFWPGPLSVVLNSAAGINPALAPGGKIALRISPNEKARDLIERVGPITSTSANISGEPPAKSVKDIKAQNLAVDAVLDGGETPGGEPSTVIDLVQWPPVCIRQGAIAFQDIIGSVK